jgi:hypothetical protein
VIAGVLGAAFAAGPTRAAIAPEASGWWQRAATDPPVGGLPGPELPRDARPPLVAVPEGGLYVANDATGARALSAVRFAAAGGTAELKLEIAGDPLLPVGARLVACAVAPTWEATVDGRWESRPEIHCERAVAGVFDAARSEVTFPLGALTGYTSERGIEVAVVPADGESASYALAFDAPSAESLQVEPVAPSPAPPASPAVDPSGEPSAPFRAPPFVVTPEPSAALALPAALSNAPVDVGRPAVAERISRRIGTDAAGRAAVTALLALFALAAWLWSGGPRGRQAEETE